MALRALKESQIKIEPIFKLSKRDTKELVLAGINGDIDFPELLSKYKFGSTTRDYSMVLMIIAFCTYCLKSANLLLRAFALTVARVGSYLDRLFEELRSGNGQQIKYYMGTYFCQAMDIVLQECLPGDENKAKRTKIINNFRNQAGKITPWRVNGADVAKLIDDFRFNGLSEFQRQKQAELDADRKEEMDALRKSTKDRIDKKIEGQHQQRAEQIVELGAQLEAKKAELQSEESSSEEKIQELASEKAKLAQLSSALEEKKKSSREAQSDVDRLEFLIRGAKTNQKALEDKKTKLPLFSKKAERDELSSKIQEYVDKAKQYGGELNPILETKKKLEKEIKSLETLIEKATKAIGKLDEATKAPRAKIDALAKKIKELESEINALKDKTPKEYYDKAKKAKESVSPPQSEKPKSRGLLGKKKKRIGKAEDDDKGSSTTLPEIRSDDSEPVVSAKGDASEKTEVTASAAKPAEERSAELTPDQKKLTEEQRKLTDSLTQIGEQIASLDREISDSESALREKQGALNSAKKKKAKKALQDEIESIGKKQEDKEKEREDLATQQKELREKLAVLNRKIENPSEPKPETTPEPEKKKEAKAKVEQATEPTKDKKFEQAVEQEATLLRQMIGNYKALNGRQLFDWLSSQVATCFKPPIGEFIRDKNKFFVGLKKGLQDKHKEEKSEIEALFSNIIDPTAKKADGKIYFRYFLDNQERLFVVDSASLNTKALVASLNLPITGKLSKKTHFPDSVRYTLANKELWKQELDECFAQFESYFKESSSAVSAESVAEEDAAKSEKDKKGAKDDTGLIMKQVKEILMPKYNQVKDFLVNKALSGELKYSDIYEICDVLKKDQGLVAKGVISAASSLARGMYEKIFTNPPDEKMPLDMLLYAYDIKIFTEK